MNVPVDTVDVDTYKYLIFFFAVYIIFIFIHWDVFKKIIEGEFKNSILFIAFCSLYKYAIGFINRLDVIYILWGCGHYFFVSICRLKV